VKRFNALYWKLVRFNCLSITPVIHSWERWKKPVLWKPGSSLNNLVGVLRVTNAVLPGMRQQGDGRIVNISSVLGFLPAPYWGIYAASKHAVEGYTETLDHEIRRFGVRALLVEPAYTRTKLSGNTKVANITLDVYTDERKRLTSAALQNIERGDDPRMVAEAVYNALTAKSPRLRYPVGKGVGLSRMRRFVPAGMFDKSFRKQFQLD
jgi:short-subunit dehydrogenase